MVLDDVGNYRVFLIIANIATLHWTVVDEQIQVLCPEMLPGSPVVTRLCGALAAYPEIFWLPCFLICPFALSNVGILFVLFQVISSCKTSFATKTLLWAFFQLSFMQ